jgi:cell division protein FtsB
MVIKRRFRGIALPFMLYLVSGVAAVFFINEAGNGSRGIETRNSLLSEIARLSTELSKVTAERLALERRNALVGLFHVNAEFLEERSRAVLNRGNRNDVVIMTVD